MSASRATDFATDFAIDWPVEGAIVRCGATRLGTGPPALMLPALSSISTRAEMRPLQEVLSERFETLAVDWPAFGDHPKPACRWTPAMLDAYIGHILTDVAPRPSVLFAAGHAAGYALRAVTRAPDEAGRRVLIAPTWRGPFPTMLGRRPGWLARLRGAVDAPALGPLVYALNLNDLVIRRMARGHVYSDPNWLTAERLADKRPVAHAAGARFASIRFVTGALDPFETGEAFRAAAMAMADRLLLVWGAETPRKSLAEMQALAATLRAAPVVLPRGKLGVHEEFPHDVGSAIRSLLSAADDARLPNKLD